MGEKISIEPTKKTPAVLLDRGVINIGGRSIPEDSTMFYSPIVEWIRNYADDEATPTRVDLNFEYINTSSTKWVFAALRELGRNKRLNNMVEVNWYFEEGDDDMEELGYILKSLMPGNFKIIETEE